VYRRVIRRRRAQRTCGCPGPRTVTAPPAPKLIPKSLLGVSVWVEILLDKFASYRPTQRLLEQWRLLGLDLAAGTITDGLQRLEPLFGPIMEALLKRNRLSHYKQADETRWLVFVEQQGKVGFGWWLWVFNSEDTVVYLLDDSRSHQVPEDHYPPQASGVLMVDRYSAYKAMLQVKNGTLILVFCWAHVRRDFVRVGKGWPELKSWALEWLRRIRDLYRWNRQRLAQPTDPAPQAGLRQAVAAMRQQLDTELADPALRTPVRKVLTSLQEHWSGLTHFVDDPRIPTTSRNDACVGRLWGGRTITAPEPDGVVAWPQCSFRSWPLSSCGRSILGCGSTGTCKAAPKPGAMHQPTLNHSYPGSCPKTCARNCGWKCQCRNQTPVDPRPPLPFHQKPEGPSSLDEQRSQCARSTGSAVVYYKRDRPPECHMCKGH
jgi:Transposase IS66 family